jgi:ribonuclease HII
MSQLECGFSRGPMGQVDLEAFAQGYEILIGVDEAGRGPLAGPVSTAGVAVTRAQWEQLEGVNDSKQMSAPGRAEWEERLLLRGGWHRVDLAPAEIDRLNILGASLEGMRRCAEALLADFSGARVLVLVDGNHRLRSFCGAQQPLVKGDARSRVIAAASVLAKEHRDREMAGLDALYPGYGLGKHKGYPTPAHLRALAALGPSPVHRLSYAPVAQAAATAAARRR